jgi:ankyrin repeat protein
MVHPLYSAIHVAADHNKWGIVPFLFDNGAEIKFKEAHGCMKLHQDSYLHFIDMARLLVRQNANSAVTCCNNGSPYHMVRDGIKVDGPFPSIIQHYHYSI